MYDFNFALYLLRGGGQAPNRQAAPEVPPPSGEDRLSRESLENRCLPSVPPCEQPSRCLPPRR